MAYFYVFHVWDCTLLARGRLEIRVGEELYVFVYLLVCPLVVHHDSLEAVLAVLDILNVVVVVLVLVGIVVVCVVVRCFVVNVLETLVQAAFKLVELRIICLTFNHTVDVKFEIVEVALVFVGHHGPVDVDTNTLEVVHFVHGLGVAVKSCGGVNLVGL